MGPIVAVIPVRLASSRFPGKPLALLHGLPMLIDAVTAGVPSAYVDDLDHGPTDLHGFVAAGLIYRSNIDPNLNEILDFNQRPGWQKASRTFANIDDDEAAVFSETVKAVARFL